MGLYAFIVVGIVVGLGTRAVVLGRDRIRLLPTALFALAGSFVGGILGILIYGRRMFELHTEGMIVGTLIAFTLLFIAGVRAGGRRRATF